MEYGVARECFSTSFIKDVSPAPPEISFPKPAWVRLNHPQTGVGIFHSETYKRGIAFTAGCECGAKEQTAEHVLTSCPIYHYPNSARALSDVNKNLVTRLTETCPVI